MTAGRLGPEREALLARPCRREVARGRACGHPYRDHFGDGPCIAVHRSGGASTCECVGFSAEALPLAAEQRARLPEPPAEQMGLL
jgi:hypothetical protein